MAEIAEGGGGGHKDGGKKRPKKSSTRVDMTPMVDLAFLLLTFFVLTSTFSKPKIMSLVYPAKPKGPIENTNVVFNAITFLLSEDKIYYYEGEFKQGVTQLEETSFGPTGVRKLLADKNRYVLETKIKLEDRLARKQIVDSIYEQQLVEAQKDDRALKVLIKTDLKATCKNFIDLIDELRINQIGVVAPVDLTKSEQDLLNQKLGQ
jgi:biopolymer transport protein ExbD